jgi:hypothetical protein
MRREQLLVAASYPCPPGKNVLQLENETLEPFFREEAVI